jgi:cytochrome c
VKIALGLSAVPIFLACSPTEPAPEPVRQEAREADELALGERLSRQCLACHGLEPGRNTPAAPTLYRIVDRPVAAEPGYNYSPALRRLATQHPTWSFEVLDQFLTDPAALAPGNEMGFAGLADPAERRALIAWLAQ